LFRREDRRNAAQLKRRGASEENRKVYLAAAVNLLGIEPRIALTPDVLSRIVAEAKNARDVATARQLGWYTRDFSQHETAARNERAGPTRLQPSAPNKPRRQRPGRLQPADPPQLSRATGSREALCALAVLRDQGGG